MRKNELIELKKNPIEYKKFRERVNEYYKKYYYANYKRNLGKHRKIQKKWRDGNGKEYNIKYNREWRKKNRSKMREYHQRWLKKNEQVEKNG